MILHVDTAPAINKSTDVYAFLSCLHDPGDTFEVRVLHCPDKAGGKWTNTVAGWFDDIGAAEVSIAGLEQREPPAIYCTVNPCVDSLLARSPNALIEKPKATTSDHDIKRRRWLFVDIDPVRPAGVSSTNAELQEAESLADTITTATSEAGWSKPIRGMSGNGCYLLYRIDLPSDDESLELVKRVLAKMAEANTPGAEVDQTGSNAARIVKVLGTIARKGSNYTPSAKPESDHRPHRRSWFIPPVTMPQPVSREKLEAFAPPEQQPAAPEKKSGGLRLPPRTKNDPNQWLADWLKRHSVPVGQSSTWNGSGVRYVLQEAPLCTHDPDGAGWVGVNKHGKVAAGCQHDNCRWDWKDLRQHYEPGCYDGKTDGVAWLLSDEKRTENALAARFIDLHGDDLRYVPLWRKWLVWDGRRFKIDNDSAAVLRLARKFAGKLWNDFAELAKNDSSLDEKSIKLVTSFCKETNKEKNIGAFIKLARADYRVCVSVDDINANASLLNLRNGTYDLETGEFRQHDRRDLLTQMAAVSYDRDADCPRWLETLDLIFSGDSDLIRFVQQVLGYSLSGDTGEHVLPMAYGSGCNGKSTVWNAVLELAGDYGALANDSLLLGDKSAHPTEKASLYQKRIVAISEPEQGSRMRESRVKELTGDSLITARRMREDFWTFRRTHTFWLSTNHLPRVSGTDEGIWRRIKLIPFEVDLRDKVDPVPDFHSLLVREEGAGILNWLLDGYKQYRRQGGFTEPESVRRCGQQYRGDQDHIGCFVADCCLVGPQYMAPASALYDSYKEWGGHWSKTAFGKELGERFEKEKPTAGEFRRQVIYHGICLEK